MKLNKKGFTLVELLAVIAILAILLIMVTPNVLSMFTNGRKDAFITNVQSVWQTATEQAVAAQMSVADIDKRPPYCNNCGATTNPATGNLLTSTSNNASYYVAFDANSNVSVIAVSDDNYCYASSGTPSINISRDDLNEGQKISCSVSSNTVSCSCINK